ncbi:MAG: beta-propeller domain-containing protein, partial [Candidatus Anstonellaceae archaeon]
GASQLENLQKDYSEKLSSLYKSRAADWQKTAISKISLSSFTPIAKGEVPGYLINQFSMDESKGYFRVATTIQPSWWAGWDGQASANALYVLDDKLQIVGKVEGIAPGETIYSVRFMGDRAYMVTFKKVDPFFVIDLSDPNSPKLLGKLKIPGYSDYLHPYDDSYIIGLGKEAIPSKEGDFALQQGVKLSLFDVRNPEDPKEVAKFEIGDRGTESYALHDHKAFLFSKDLNLLVIPITLAKIDKSKYAGGEIPDWAYGDFVFQGAYVFKVSPEEGFLLRGTITHASEEELLKSGEYFYAKSNVLRSLYMDDYLYTVSNRMVKANDLNSLAHISSVQISG